jgi:hypothetical protein
MKYYARSREWAIYLVIIEGSRFARWLEKPFDVEQWGNKIHWKHRKAKTRRNAVVAV